MTYDQNAVPSCPASILLANSTACHMSLANKTLFITGGSRGIGLAIALRAARDGANIAIAAKTAEPHPKLAGTIYSAAQEIEDAGGKALPLQVDIRDAAAVQAAVQRTAEVFGGIDICINNASAINLSTTEIIDIARFDLIQQINMRGTFVTSRACVPYLKKSANPHILTLSPPLTMRADWFAQNLPYTLSKYGMSMVMLGMAQEFKADGIACNSLWPRTTIATAAVEYALGGEVMLKQSRSPAIMADAAYAILNEPAAAYSGQFLIDDEVLAAKGVTDFEPYSHTAGAKLFADIFVDPTARVPGGIELSAYR
jgi:citronellol/citronellal dehydrogenase